MPYTVVFRFEVLLEGDVQHVQKSKLRSVIEALQANPGVGKPLTGALMGYLSTRIGGSESLNIYHVNEATKIVEVIAMGQRKDSAVYDTATSRVD